MLQNFTSTGRTKLKCIVRWQCKKVANTRWLYFGIVCKWFVKTGQLHVNMWRKSSPLKILAAHSGSFCISSAMSWTHMNIFFKWLKGCNTHVVHQNNLLGHCTSKLLSLAPGCQTYSTGFEVVIKAADEGGNFFRLKIKLSLVAGLFNMWCIKDRLHMIYVS